MARLSDRLPENVPGELYVDRTCIDCATCREMLPAVYAQGDGFSYVARQPRDDAETHRALMALVACPTGSIGTVSRLDASAAVASFPEPLGSVGGPFGAPHPPRPDGEVSFCGFTSRDSFGAWSYLLRRPAGNVLVDSPRAAQPLVRRLEELGGVWLHFLTHRDDVADHAALHRRFGTTRVLHRDDVTRDTASVERLLDGTDPVALDDELLAIPTPGHTRGHAVLLFRERVLFTGDHLAFSARRQSLTAFRDACWYSWAEQVRSMERLLEHRFEWILPGHGLGHRAASPEAMREALLRCVEWMHRVA